MSLQLGPSDPPANVEFDETAGAVVTNHGPGTVAYATSDAVRSAPDGTLSSGSTATLYGSQWFAATEATAISWRPLPVESSSGLPANILTKTANFTAANGDFILADATAGNITITLPSAPAAGALVAVKKIDVSVNTVTIDPTGAGTVDGSANASTATQWAGAIFEHVGSDVWRIVASMSTTGPVGPAGPTGPTGPAGPEGPAGTEKNLWIPPDNGLLAANFDPAFITSTGTIPAGYFRAFRIPIKKPITVTKLVTCITAAGTGLTGCKAGIWKLDGTRIATTGDVSTTWQSISNPEMTLTADGGQSLDLPAADVIALMYVGAGTGVPSFGKGPAASNALNLNLASPALRSSYAVAASFPAGAMPTQSADTATLIWVGLK